MSDGAAPPVRLSVLDRLLDNSTWTAPSESGASPAALKRALVRDLEWLLNTRRIAEPAPASFPEINSSVYHFGLPDVSSRSADSIETQQQLAADIEECLRIFEPRLTQVRVSIREAAEEEGRLARFVVDALLRMDPEPQRVVFDTVLVTPTGTFFVRGGDDE